MGTRVDTPCDGAAFTMIKEMGRVCNVGGFHTELEQLKGVPITTTAMAYDHPVLQEMIILVFPKSLFFGAGMEHSLICPNQLWDNNIVFDLRLKQYGNGESLHGLMMPEKDNYSYPFNYMAVVLIFLYLFTNSTGNQ